MIQSDELYRVKEAALLLNVSAQTLHAWIRKGKIPVVKLPSGRYRIPESEVLKVMQRYQPETVKAS